MKKLIPLLLAVLMLGGCHVQPTNGAPAATAEYADAGAYEAYIQPVGMATDSGFYTVFTLRYGGQTVDFEGKHVADGGRAPRLIIADISGDSRPEIIVILCVAYGEGVNLEVLRIFDSRDLSEYEAVDLPLLLQTAGKFRSTDDSFTGNIMGCRFEIPKGYGDIPEGELYDRIVTNTCHRYSVEDGVLICTFPCRISPTTSAGEIVMNLELSDEGKFICGGVEYKS